jgi:hypothetical protein
MTSHSQRTRYTRADLLRVRENSTATPSHEVRRRLWYLSLLRKKCSQQFSVDESPQQDTQPAQLVPRVLAPPQSAPRNARLAEHTSGVTITRRPHLPSQLRLASFNARTLRQKWRLLELTNLADRVGISIIAVQEHRRARDESADLDRGWIFKAAPASPQGTGGIGFLLSPRASKALLSISFPSDRLGQATFAVKDRRLHVICTYAPTPPTTLEDPVVTETFYDHLGNLLDSLPLRDHTFIAGDFNAPLVADGRLVKNSCGRPNLNSGYLTTFIRARDLIAVNGCMRQRYRKLPTFRGPNGRTTRLDWILCPFSLRSRMRRSFTIRPVCVRSDHSLVVCDTHLRWPKMTKAKPTPEWRALCDRETRESFLAAARASSSDLEQSAEAFLAFIGDAVSNLLSATT